MLLFLLIIKSGQSDTFNYNDIWCLHLDFHFLSEMHFKNRPLFSALAKRTINMRSEHLSFNPWIVFVVWLCFRRLALRCKQVAEIFNDSFISARENAIQKSYGDYVMDWCHLKLVKKSIEYVGHGCNALI